jgi:hypothetical protein
MAWKPGWSNLREVMNVLIGIRSLERHTLERHTYESCDVKFPDLIDIAPRL